ncbi:hypothetical protein [Larsenimonas suaedae]|uniref:DUF2238 domain-containing protein n=1 Tax=Larsenimonas suaedae TaxID=1851019 RepID=A0ABU1GXM7_9GAMM|nr:hypothetical protein [Larsenimonas suaedae]MCM2973404.1 hypothetical protein [Larsenimonas suaedae]MDR5896297.1 hypothetical protein [Larsenimonas suaedae]
MGAFIHLVSREYRDNPLFKTAVKVILAFTTIVVLMGVVWESLALPPELMSLHAESSLPNRYAQGLMLVAVFMFLVGFSRHGSRAFLALAALYAFVWFDDTMMYHEHVGAFLDQRGITSSWNGLRAQDVGELIGWGLAAIPMALIFLWAWLGRRKGDVGMLVVFGACFGLLVFCGVVVDMLHMLLGGGDAMDVGWVEDGGEIASVALACVASTLFATMKPERWFASSAPAARAPYEHEMHALGH